MIGSTPTVPISIALVAGGLAVINPCGFPLLPAFLSYYLGADERRLPAAPTGVLQGQLVGGLVTVGFLGFFALVGLPVSYGVAAIARAVPWAGLATGAALALAGLLTLLGRQLRLPAHLNVQPRRERRLGPMLLFGVGYGAASLGCTLPLFLTLVGASLSGGGKITTFRLRSRHGRRADGALRAGCSGGKSAAPPQPRSTAATGSTKSGMPGPRQLTDVRDVGQLRSLFNTRSGEPRLILLAPPT